MTPAEPARRGPLRLLLESLPGRFARPPWAAVVVSAIVALVLWRLWYLRTGGNWDFITYYWAAKAQAKGLDPYQLANLSQVAGHQIVLRYLYPPGVLYLLRPLTWLSLHAAIIVFLSLKVACLVALLLVWRSCLGTRETLPLVVLAVLGFSSTVFNDCFAGNVSIFEQLTLWVGFWFLLRQRIVAFAVMVVLASVAKMTPAAFLLLLLFTTHRRRLLVLTGAAAASALSIVASFGGSWSRLDSYFKIVLAVDERGPTNSALLPLLKDCHDHLVRKYHVAALLGPSELYLLVLFLLVIVTGLVLVRIFRRHGNDPAASLDYIIGAVLLYALALPRFKDYSYVLLIPAVVVIGRRIKNALPLLILFACLTGRNTLARYALDDFPLADLFWKYFNLIIALVLWIAFVSSAWARGRHDRQESGPARS